MEALHKPTNGASLNPRAILVAALPGTLFAPRNGVPDPDGVRALHEKIMRNYFRLVRAHRDLLRRAPHTQPAAAEIVTAQLEVERTRLAQEVHAAAGQALAGIEIHLEILDDLIPEQSQQVRSSLHRIGLLAQDVQQQLRSIAKRIHPPDWEALPLATAIETLLNITGIPDKYQASLEIELVCDPPHPVKVLLYGAVQEGLANIVRHAQATQVRVSLSQYSNRIRLMIEDNGKGFDDAMMGGAPGIGIRSLRNQAHLLDGEFKLRSGPGGTTVILLLPLRSE